MRVHFILADLTGLAMMHPCKPNRKGAEKRGVEKEKRNRASGEKRDALGSRSERGSKPSFPGTVFGSYAASAVGGSRAPTRSGGRPEWYKRKTDLNSQIFRNLPYILGE